VLSTLHTIDTTETIARVIDFFPPYQQKQIRLTLAATLKGIVSLRLIPSMQGGLVPAVEVLVMTGSIREYIIDPDKTYLIRDAIEGGQYDGMVTFDQSLLSLYQDRRITLDDAMAMAHNAHDFKIKVRHLGVSPTVAAQSGIY
jgi:twitching motility protein PilT